MVQNSFVGEIFACQRPPLTGKNFADLGLTRFISNDKMMLFSILSDLGNGFKKNVEEAKVLSQEDALPLSEVREWSGKSDELERTLKRNLQGFGGIRPISASDFHWFEQKIGQRLRECGVNSAQLNP